eukprot:CAMPEP_0198286622 /NCGR_PEP_ID=MMETSP1449-20131203/5663_1 /TAXON_ID=420275 /ORGANISM="Attheya septentrionalis, Strain CCMP2084" /LENGTH=446 /DNA_ID=CAMNT_0043984407 /DNA_START=119 /DNA_END=1459 /DNA_ORIENTATION=+
MKQRWNDHHYFVTTTCLAVWAILMACQSISGVRAFGMMGSPSHGKNRWKQRQQQQRRTYRYSTTGIRFMLMSNKKDEQNNDTEKNVGTKKQRVFVRGVSVTPEQGFVVVLGGGRSTMVVPVTTRDTMQVKSPEALTILQLIGNIDMAGVLLPPQLLQSLVALYCSIHSMTHEKLIMNQSLPTNTTKNPENTVFVEDELGLSLQDEDEANNANDKTTLRMIMEGINEFVQETLPSSSDQKSESSGVICGGEFLGAQSSAISSHDIGCRAPHAYDDDDDDDDDDDSNTDIVMDCTVMVRGQFQSLSIPMVGGWWKDLVYEFDEPCTSAAYVTMALALRYHAPLWIETQIQTQADDDPIIDMSSTDVTAMNDALPTLFQSTQQIQQESTGVKERIQTGFRVHQLQTALQMAVQQGDSQAATKIRQELDSLDSMDDLPTTTTNNNNPDEN